MADSISYDELKRREAENMNQALAFFGQGDGSALTDEQFEKMQARESENHARAIAEAQACEDFFGGSVLNMRGPGGRLHEAARQAGEEKLAAALYVYNSVPSAGNGRLLKPGDILLCTGEDEHGQAAFMSSRGSVLGYGKNSLQRELEAGSLKPMFPDGASRGQLACAIRDMHAQSMYMDADVYKKPCGEFGARAFYNLNKGDDMAAQWCGVEHAADGFTVSQGVSGKYAIGDNGGYHDFNPSGGPVVPLSEYDQFRRDELRKEAARPVNKMLRAIGLVKDGRFSPEPRETAYSLAAAQCPWLVPEAAKAAEEASAPVPERAPEQVGPDGPEL